jgi:hypothetical protein
MVPAEFRIGVFAGLPKQAALDKNCKMTDIE